MQALALMINDKEIYFINIYGPNNDDCIFFWTIRKILTRKQRKNIYNSRWF